MWDIKEYFEQRRIHRYRERDLKGVVDGLKYTDEIPKKIPSLLDKLEYVKSNLNKWNLEKIDELSIDGVVITRSFPPIKSYKNIKFISLSQIKSIS